MASLLGENTENEAQRGVGREFVFAFFGPMFCYDSCAIGVSVDLSYAYKFYVYHYTRKYSEESHSTNRRELTQRQSPGRRDK
jgi:hypothetical protein